MKAKKSLGQNFLIDNNIIEKIVKEVSALNEDLIIEIGPGRGALTKKLKNYNCNIIAYEADTDLKIYLDSLEDNKTKVIYGDFLKSNVLEDIKNIKYKDIYIVGNLPYYITTPIIENVIGQKIPFKKFTLMVQKEVADRFMAKPKSSSYGYFTVLLDYYFDVKKVVNVSKNSFSPAPKVDSTVLSFTPKKEIKEVDSGYFTFLKLAFSQKRKTLKNNLKNYDWQKIKKILEKYSLSQSVRAEELSQDIFLEIYNCIKG
jgi:16S rRNA (adenine1518-N6/adenine1519-N6)-dimethyltransferase